MRNEPGDPQAWLEYADDDLRLSRLAVDAAPSLLNGACFHAQQAAEKFLKAFLIDQKEAFPRSHDLDLLAGLCRRRDPGFAQIADVCELLNGFGAPVRYPPTGFDAPTESQARQAVAAAEQVAAFVRPRIGAR